MRKLNENTVLKLFEVFILVIALIMVLIVMLTSVSEPKSNTKIKKYTGCYVCSNNTYIKFQGKDSLKKRKKVEEQFGCKPVKTTKRCITDKFLE